MSDGPAEPPILGVRIVHLEATLQGLTAGAMLGLGVFVATNWLVLKGGQVVGPHLALLSQFFVGYDVTFAGSLVGFAWGFAYGFLVGYGVSAVYNRIVTLRGASRS